MIGYPCAKINLGLNVVAKRPDGYHNLETVFYPINLCDTLEINAATNASDGCELEVAGLNVDAAPDDNLVVKAYRAVKHLHPEMPGVVAKLTKHIPSQAGLGGGSSDAAAVILGIVKLLKLPATKQELVKIAKKIGSDVPFFLENKMALCEGIGDKITLIEKYSKYYVLLIKPHEGLSTKEVYQKYDELHELEKSEGEEKEKRKRIDYQKLMKLYDNGKFKEFKKEAVNDLYKPAKKLLPVIEKIKHILIADYGFSLVGMTGSGSCLYVVSKNKRELYKFMKENFERYQIELTKIM